MSADQNETEAAEEEGRIGIPALAKKAALVVGKVADEAAAQEGSSNNI